MRTCLTAVLLAPLAVATVSAQQPSGVVFVGDMQSIDRAVLDAADLPLPVVGSNRGVKQPSAMASAPSGGVRPAAYQAKAPSGGVSMQPTQEAAPKRKTLFGSLKAPAWLTGKKSSAKPTVDPFNNAAMQARQKVAQAGANAPLRDPSLQPIPTQAGQQANNTVTPAAYQPRTSQPPRGQAGNTMPRPMQVQQAKQQQAIKAKQSSRQSGIVLRKQNGPRTGLLSGLFGERKSQPTTAAQTMPYKSASGRSSSPAPGAMAYSNGPSVQKKPSSNTLRTAPLRTSSKPAPRPMQRVAARAPAEPKSLYREPRGVATYVSGSSKEPAGSVVMISDVDVAKKTAKKSAPMPLVVGPTSKPIKKQPSVVAKAAPKPAAPTPLIVTDSQVKPIEKAPTLVAPKSAPKYARTTPGSMVRKAARPQPVVQPADAEPSERSRALLAEAHGLAASAAGYEDFTAVIQRCRYVLAIDQSKEAQAYANQLGGWALTKRGEKLETEGRFEEASNDFHDALASDPECWRAIHALGVLAAREGNADEAARRFDETIELNPEYAKAYSNRAALAVQNGDYQAALHDYQRAIEIDPDMAIAHTGRGRVCHMLGLLDQGLQHLDAAAMLDPTDGMIAIGRGDLLTDLGRYGQALQAYQRAIELEPNLAAAHRNLAWMQATCPVETFRDGESALKHAELAERLVQEADDLTLDTKAAALAAVGRFDEAKELQREAIELAPESDAGVYLERLSLYERGESFTSKPVAIRQATYMK